MEFEQAILEGVPNLGTFEPEKIEYIQLGMIDDDPNNFYELRDIETLADNISVCGLQQPIRLRPNPTADGRYIIVSGHRRRAALTLLAKEDSRWARAMCIVDRRLGSEALRELQLIYANANTRQLTSYEIGEQAKKVESLLYQLKEEGYEFPGRMRDHVAKAVNVSKSKLSRINVINKQLIPEFHDAWQHGKYPEASAYAMAQLKPEVQRLIYIGQIERKSNVAPSTVNEIRTKDLATQIAKAEEQCSRLTCPTAGTPCGHADKRRKKAARLENWHGLNCIGCCIDCANLATCKDNCQESKIAQATRKRTAKQAEAQAEQRQLERDKPKLDFILGAYHRTGQRMRELGLTVPDLLNLIGVRETDNKGKDYTNLVMFGKEIPKNDIYYDMPWCAYGGPHQTKALIAFADLLQCSTDYLLGREERKPSAGWKTGTPKKEGTYIVVIALSQFKQHYTKLDWRGGGWKFPGSDELAVDESTEVKAWIEPWAE